MVRTTIGILRGGTSSEYPLSLKTGAALMNALPEEHYDVRDILVDKQGYWHQRGVPVDPVRALAHVDVVLNALHGGVGEDGTVQRILERTGVAYAGARPHAASVSLNKLRAREVLEKAGVRMPAGMGFSAREERDTGAMAREVFERFGPPYVVKPVNEGAGAGILIAPTIVDLPHALADVLEIYGAALVEEFVRGHDVSAGVIEGFRNEDLYALPPAHVIAPAHMRILGRDAHVEEAVQHIVPSNFSHEEKRAIEDMARAAHRALGLSHFSRADIRLSKYGKPYLLEVNAHPGLYAGASFPPMLEAVGSSVREFAEHAISLARTPKT